MKIGDYQISGDAQDDNGQSLMGISGADDPEDVEVVGQAIWYTIGSDFVISSKGTDGDETGREWLVRRMDELELPEFMVPPETSTKGAFTRTRDHLVNPRNDEITLDGKTVEFETKRAGTDSFHLLANAYFTADELGQEDGEWNQTTVGVFRYMTEHGSMATIPKIDRDDRMWDAWEHFAQRGTSLMDEMEESHIGRDIQKMVNRFTHDWTHTVKFRDGGAVYFVPAQYNDALDSLKTLIEEINARFKTHGKNAEFKRIPVVNDDERRQMVEERARQYIEGKVEDALDDAMEAVKENEEELTDEIIQSAEATVKDGDSFAAQYNDLLDLRLSVEDVLDDFSDEIEGGVKGEIIDSLKADSDAPADEVDA
jgi:hypothetical protein